MELQTTRRSVLAGGFSLLTAAGAVQRDGLHYAGLLEIAARIRSRELSPVDVTRAQLSRIAALDSKLNAYFRVLADDAMNQARQAEAAIRAGKYVGPLHGIPIAIKDLFYTKGVATMGGCKALAHNIPTFDATVVARVKNAGAVILGKLNTTEGANTGYHRDFRVPRNPWGATRWPGFSSSGSGVAAAAGLCYGSLGTDTGGSIRYPSAANGIVGLKPTWGRVSRYGVLPLAPTLDHVGPMTRRVADAAAMLEVIAGYDQADPTSLSDPVADYCSEIGKGIKGVRVGYDDAYATAGVASPMAGAIRQAVRVLEKLGARIVDAKMPGMDGLDAWLTLASAEAAAAHEATYPSQAGDYGAGFRNFLERGSQVTGAQLAKAIAWRANFVGKVRETFRSFDMLVCPSMNGEAFVYDPEDAYAGPGQGTIDGCPVSFFAVSGRFTFPFDYNGYPTLSLPCGVSPDGMPLSAQFVARPLSEALLCRAGHAYETATEWHRRHPPL